MNRHAGVEAFLIEPLLDADEVAERLGVSPRFVRRLVEERRIPFCKVGKFVRFRPTDVRAWLARSVVEPTRTLRWLCLSLPCPNLLSRSPIASAASISCASWPSGWRKN
jgi:excisionase family DNA binding protein